MTRQTVRTGTGSKVRLDLGGFEVVLLARRHRRARHISLRIDPAVDDGAVLVLPWNTPLDEGLNFARSKARWLRRSLAALPPRIPFIDGARIPVLGTEHVIRHHPGFGPAIWSEAGVIHVGGDGDPKRVGDRVRSWLRELARREITRKVADKAKQIDLPYGRITIRDARTRWGSCTEDGNLAFSWRLILAPERILDYVVGHEVAHLKELNHGPRFREVERSLVPDNDTASRWLNREGNALLRYG